jgi:CheY-like chemotaxis protein
MPNRRRDSAAKRPPTIFLVEDHENTARALKMYLELLGHEVHVAHDVKSAVKMAGDIDYDVLVSDIGLPDGTGWDLMKKLNGARPYRAIAISGFASPNDIARSKAAGFFEHLAKPITPEDLMPAIGRAAADL